MIVLFFSSRNAVTKFQEDLSWAVKYKGGESFANIDIISETVRDGTH